MTVKSARRVLDIFLKDYADFTVILPIGTNDHDQCLFIKKIAIEGLAKWRQFVAKVYDPNGTDGVLMTPTKTMVKKLSLTKDNMEQLIYHEASHRMVNKRKDCAVLMWLESYIAFKYNRTPFIRSSHLEFIGPVVVNPLGKKLGRAGPRIASALNEAGPLRNTNIPKGQYKPENNINSD